MNCPECKLPTFDEARQRCRACNFRLSSGAEIAAGKPAATLVQGPTADDLTEMAAEIAEAETEIAALGIKLRESQNEVERLKRELANRPAAGVVAAPASFSGTALPKPPEGGGGQ